MNNETIGLAIRGLETHRQQIADAIADLKSKLGGTSAGPGVKHSPARVETGTRKRTMSPAARRRISLAQKKRWAARRRG